MEVNMNKIAKKVLSIAAIVLVLLIGLLVVAITVFGNQTIKVGIETGATAALKVNVSLNSAKLSILGGSAELNGLKIQNPAGYQHPEFLTMENAAVKLKVMSVFSNTVEIEKVQFDKIQLTIEQKGVTTNNLQEILNSLPKSEEGTAPKPEVKTEKQGSGKQLVIKELVINGIEVKAKLLPIPGKADTITLRLNPIVMKDLGSDKPINTAELTAKILKAIATGVADQGKDLLPTDMVNSIGSGLADQGKKVLDTAGEAGKGVIEGAGGALKGLFQKKEK
jgi:hypothetical protein